MGATPSPVTTIFELVAQEAKPERRRIIIAATFTGIANTIALGLVTQISQTEAGGASLSTLGVFVIAIALYTFGARYTNHSLTAILESAICRIKTRLVAKIESASMAKLERIGTAQIYDRIIDNLSLISESAGRIAFLLQSLCIIALSTLYLASLSIPGFLTIALLMALGVVRTSAKNKEVGGYFAKSAQTRLTFFNQLTDLLRGFKEIKFSWRRGQELHEDVVQTARSLRDDTKSANALLDENYIFFSCLLFVALGSIVFVLPRLFDVDVPLQQAIIAGVLFSWGPFCGCIGGVPAVLRANFALTAIVDLESRLDDAVESAPGVELEDPWNGGFTKALEIDELGYTYTSGDGSDAFSIGPVSLTLTKGETIFIVGGNGSGKSTLLKNLTGLYQPSSGVLRVDDVPVTPASVAAYRELFSAIYSDFHLFSRLYGLSGIEESSVSALLEQMHLQDKTSFANNRFTRRTLSTGQRKRLAMIVTLLEDRPICIFDEWAADQDPEFRRYFYEELLPALKARGKTVIAVSHDDRYFRCADRVVTLEFGKVRSIESGSISAFIPTVMPDGSSSRV